MATLEEQFATASEEVQALSERPDNDTLLRLYALYKQATSGDVTGTRPGLFNMVGRAKYDAWAGLEGTPPDDAKQAYIDLVNSLKTS